MPTMYDSSIPRIPGVTGPLPNPGVTDPAIGPGPNPAATKLQEMQQTKTEPAKRFDAGKPKPSLLPPEWLFSLAQDLEKLGPGCRIDLVPTDVLALLALHYGNGAVKYGDDNWKAGMSWSRTYDPMMRHSLKFWAGEENDTDDKTGFVSPHPIAVAWNAFTLAYYQLHNTGADDRPSKEKSHV